MTDKHGVEVKIGDKVIAIDMKFNPPLYIGKITDMSGNMSGNIDDRLDIIELRENICDSVNHPKFYSYEFELWTPERELIAKLEV